MGVGGVQRGEDGRLRETGGTFPMTFAFTSTPVFISWGTDWRLGRGVRVRPRSPRGRGRCWGRGEGGVGVQGNDCFPDRRETDLLNLRLVCSKYHVEPRQRTLDEGVLCNGTVGPPEQSLYSLT